MGRLRIVGGFALLAACGSGREPRTDASPAFDAPSADVMPAACNDQQAVTLITSYCGAGFHDGTGAPCVSDVGQCEAKGAYERMTTEQTGCLCYLCQLYSYASQQQVCATSETPPGYLLQQCLAGTLRCP